jgi:ABC-2 type transport system ATP-binding protein
LISIEFKGLVKRYKDLTAVDELNASIESGRITGFLGPNGAGKSTALRCLLGLAAATDGEALIEGKPYSHLTNPLAKVGAVLDSSGFNGALTAMQNLKVICAASGLNPNRIPELLELVELGQAANKRTKGYSLGMKQRLSLAAALLGDPDILVLDEPANGLDPVGIAWLRQFLRRQADAGKTVLVSSHQLAEMQHTVDDVIIINHGKLIAAGPIGDVTRNPADPSGAAQSLEDAFMRLIGVSK